MRRYNPGSKLMDLDSSATGHVKLHYNSVGLCKLQPVETHVESA
jgi:hypothetical protein